MPAITYKEWGGGLDRRIPLGVQDANKLWTLENAYITLGKKIKKRPGLVLIENTLVGTFGLANINGGLATFKTTGAVLPGAPSFAVYELDNPGGGIGTLTDILYADIFNGFPFIVALYSTNDTRHHYLDGGATLVADANCPHSGGVTKAASRIFAPDGENVRYCAAGDPRDWTTASDAGFLPTGLQGNTTTDVQACGTFESALVVFYEEGGQIWDVNVDPSSNSIRKLIQGVGCTAPASLASFFSDLMFLSPFGYRSMTVQAQTDRIDDTDVGVQIDDLVRAMTSPNRSKAVWVHQLGQYWSIFRTGLASSVVWVYTASRSSKLACWSKYTFPIRIEGIATVAGVVYLRSETSLYRFDAETYSDDSALIGVDVQMAFQDAKLPGVDKMFYGADYVFSGSPSVSYLYDPRDITKETNAQVIQGDTRTGQLVPVEVTSSAIAPHFVHSADEAFSLDLASLYFHSLAAST